MADINDYGMKVSRQGYDVKTCADHQLLYSSSFKLPVVVASGTYSLTTLGTNQTIYTHSLGYYPLFFLMYRNYGRGDHLDDSLFWDNTGGDWTSSFYMDTGKLWYNGTARPMSNSAQISWFILNANIQTAYTAPNVDTTSDSQGAISNDYGFKVSKSGIDVKSAGLANLQSFSGSSAGSVPVRHQNIHKIGTGTAVNGTTTSFSHGLTYKPMFLFYGFKSGSGYFILTQAYTIGGAPDYPLIQKYRIWTTSSQVRINNTTGGNKSVAYLVLKDPLL